MKKLLIILVLMTAACSKKVEVKYTKEQLYAKAQALDASTTFTLPVAGAASCADYAEGCISTHVVQVRKLDLIAVEFADEKQAIYAAKKVGGYYIRNWLLDDVAGEPTLMRFADSLEAKKP